jgi:hypothetical protein
MTTLGPTAALEHPTWQTAEEYHADRVFLSHSALSMFRRSRRLYNAVYVAGTMPAPPQTEAQRLGTLVHLALLEPERFERESVVMPKCLRNTKEGKAAWKDACTEVLGYTPAKPLKDDELAEVLLADGRHLVTAEHRQLVRDMAAAIWGNEDAAKLLRLDGESEHTITWQDHETGRMCKSRRDRWIQSRNLVLDIKTARDARPGPFANQALILGYHTQKAFYLDGHKAATGEDVRFAHIVVTNELPSSCAVYELHADDVALGHWTNLTAMLALADSDESDDWREPHEKGIHELRLPKRAHWADYELTD